MAMMLLPPCTAFSRASDEASAVCWLELSQIEIGLGRSTLVEFHCVVLESLKQKKYGCLWLDFKTLSTHSLARYNAGTGGYLKADQPISLQRPWVSPDGFWQMGVALCVDAKPMVN